MDVPPLASSRVVLRDWRDEDLVPFRALNADPEVMRHFPAPLSWTASDELAARIRSGLAERGWGLWAVEVRGGPKFAGFVGLAIPGFAAPFMPAVEIGWRLAREVWGRGLATEAARLALDHGFGVLGLPEVVSFTVPANTPSRRVMEKLGLEQDEQGSFEHPRVPEGHPLRLHVLYRISRQRWRTRYAGGLTGVTPGG